MNRILKKAGLILAMLVVVGGFTFAEGGSESSATAEPLEIRLFSVRGFPGEDTEIPGMIEDLISQKVGYPVTFELLGGGDDSTLHPEVDMLLAANELPDVFQRFNIQTDFLEQAATPFTTQEYKENMPRQVKRLVEIMNQLGKDEDETWAIYQNDEGLMWGAARIWEWGWIPSGQMWRSDILDELGYDIPTTLSEAEEVFEAFKAVYPDKYPATGRGQTNWQCFDLVFNAYGFSMLEGNRLVDGVVRQDFAIREFREAIEVLRRWYENGYWDPDFVNQGLEWIQGFAEGDYIVTQWIKDWNFPWNDKPTSYLEPLRDIPGAMAVAARHLAADQDSKPAQGVWDPFLTQLTVFGKQLEADRDKLHKIMNVMDLLAMDREVNYLAVNGIEGEHYIIPEGEEVPQAIPPVAGMSAAEVTAKYGFGSYWAMPVSSSRPLLSATERMYQEFVFNEDAIYNMNSIDYVWAGGAIPGIPVVDESGEPVQASTSEPWFDMVVKIMTGAEPIEYYDEWLDYYYDAGGRAWEEHATRLYNEKNG